MNTLKLEVVRFDSEDVIVTSLFTGRYFTTLSEWNQFDTEGDWGVTENYVAFDGYGYGDDPDAFAPYDESGEPFSVKYAWYDTAEGAWHTNNKTEGYYWNGSSYNFPTGKD